MNVTIRLAIEDDTSGVHRLIADIFKDYDYVLDVVNEDIHLQSPVEYFAKSGGAFWVAVTDRRLAVDGDRVVATAAVGLHDGGAEVKAVYVDRAYRRQGLATRLTSMALAHAVRCGCRNIFLWSDTRFTEAHRMYEKMGFVRAGIREIHITNKFSEYRYDLPRERIAGFERAEGSAGASDQEAAH